MSGYLMDKNCLTPFHISKKSVFPVASLVIVGDPLAIQYNIVLLGKFVSDLSAVKFNPSVGDSHRIETGANIIIKTQNIMNEMILCIVLECTQYVRLIRTLIKSTKYI